MKSHLHAGKVNMKGRKYKLLKCRCCSVQDFRADYKRKLDRKEMERGQAGNAALC